MVWCCLSLALATPLRPQPRSQPRAPGGCWPDAGVAPHVVLPPLTAAHVPACQSSGVQVNPDCLTEFEAMKIRSAYKVLTAPRLLLTRGAEAQGSPCRICSPPPALLLRST